MTAPNAVTIKDVAAYFRIPGTDPRNSLTAFGKEWKALDADEKAWFKAAIAEVTAGSNVHD